LVRAEGARLGLAHADAIESHATSALADERLIVQRRRSQDHPSQGDIERSGTEDHRQAHDDPTQSDRETHHGEAQHREARHRQARHGEAHHREAWRPQDHGSPQDRRAIDRETDDASQFHHPQEAPLREN
jgi:hypothetical protein